MLTAMGARSKQISPLRQKILAFVSALIVLSLLGSTISLYRITEINRVLDAINRVSIPLGRLFAQMQSDADVFRRELDRSLGSSHWRDPHWKPHPIPRWIQEVLDNEVTRVKELVQDTSEWGTVEAQHRWQEWANGIAVGYEGLKDDANRLNAALEQNDEATANQLYPRWIAGMDAWARQLQWGASEYDRTLRQTFALAESRATELRTGLEMILIVVVSLSLLLLWLGERALRPLGELTALARDIARRGLRREDKSALPEIPMSRQDEVSQLAREFHRMATALLEREKTVEAQKSRLEEQNRLLRTIGELNEDILNSISSVLIVTDLSGKVTQANPVAAHWLGQGHGADDNIQITHDRIIGTRLADWPRIAPFFGENTFLTTERRLDTRELGGRMYGGHLMTLKSEQGEARGAVIVLDDQTEELSLQERLRIAENLAAVGRMSAQVAHEVRNPLHSLGLEAEMAAERAGRLGDVSLKQSLQSILSSVDRLEKITDNYLKLSRLSAGQKRIVDVGEVLEAVLATYAPVCESQGVHVDWKREERSRLRVYADPDLLEQVFGNLFRNALQALEGRPDPKIHWAMGSAESGKVWARIQDNGPGIATEVRARIFNPFVTTRAQGTGLGLSFVKKVLEDHGGSVDLIEFANGDRSSRVAGHGACFEIGLPPAPSEEKSEERMNERLETSAHV